ncbi:MAG: response regulator transcription factor [Pseudonocardiaceae bacterium]
MLGPLQVIAVSFPSGGGTSDRVLAEVDRVQASGGVHVLDMLLLTKDRDGTVVQSSLGEDEDFGELVKRLFPIGDAAVNGGGEPAELWAPAQAVPVGTTVAFLLVEHRWARGLFDVVDEEGGAALGAALLTPQLGLMIEAEVTAMEEVARSIAAAQASEVDAWLSALAAQAEADKALAASARIRSAATAEALRALTDAGLVEQAAAHEAADALRAAGLIVATADEATAEAITEDATAVAVAEEKKADAVTAASITPAEIRVLRYLPTTLTFTFIADKLGISRGAAKSRAERAYKKLGVHNRVDAVERARALRVIP